ncbi:N-formylglutamate amidohydrolase [Amycolatopsis sp. 195334CR]|uniref:N-formylglutamate amidohydrolase n=1 Tax=Amycolatopsis sp. 195334CR TaxID=2814588 RepID=UPI001A8D853F|nr:N-formylglutamate amidohydrolase [Amycolatopsis sp. 195334CR]MBN6037714.1 N-formylglutamate amidohydrolase [Amycolatopsis sp. 195334CR]
MTFTVVPGTAESPVILHVPHGSRALTSHARSRIRLDDAALSTELDLMTDAHTGLIASWAGAGSAWIFRNELSRLVVDPERFPDSREEMRTVGMGAVYLRTAHGAVLREDDPEHVEELLVRHYRPYAAAMTELVDARLAAAGRAVILDVHSYPSRALPYELHGSGKRPPVCLGVDSFHTPEWLCEAAAGVFGEVEVNTPFSGAYVPLKHYRRVPEVSALMIEIRRDTYMTEPGGAAGPGLDVAAAALVDLLRLCEDHRS